MPIFYKSIKKYQKQNGFLLSGLRYKQIFDPKIERPELGGGALRHFTKTMVFLGNFVDYSAWEKDLFKI